MQSAIGLLQFGCEEIHGGKEGKDSKLPVPVFFFPVIFFLRLFLKEDMNFGKAFFFFLSCGNTREKQWKN